MSQSFSRLIKVNGRLHEFNFRRMPGKDMRYHVDVPDSRGNRIIFHMEKDEKGQWLTSGEIPDWVSNAETELVDVLQQQEEERQKSLHRKKI